MFKRKFKALKRCFSKLAIKEKMSAVKVAVTSFALALLIPGVSFAQDSTSGLVTAITPEVSSMRADLITVAGLLVGIVAVIVGAKVIFGLFKKA